MKPPEVAQLVDRVLERVEFTEPVTMDDVSAVHDAIRANLPDAFKLDTVARPPDVVIEVRDGHRVVCRRAKKILKEIPA